MKNWMKYICAGSLALAAAGTTSLALAHDGWGMNGDSCEVGTSKLLDYKVKLKLSDEQVSRLKDIKDSAKDELNPTVERLKTDVQSLKEKLDGRGNNGELASLLNKIDRERETLEKGKEKYIEQARGVLTTRQQAMVVVAIAKKYQEKMEKKNKDGDNDNDDDTDSNQEQTVTPTPDNNQ